MAPIQALRHSDCHKKDARRGAIRQRPQHETRRTWLQFRNDDSVAAPQTEEKQRVEPTEKKTICMAQSSEHTPLGAPDPVPPQFQSFAIQKLD